MQIYFMIGIRQIEIVRCSVVRRFEEKDAIEVSALIRKTLMERNSKDYSVQQIARLVEMMTPEHLIERASWTHFYLIS